MTVTDLYRLSAVKQIYAGRTVLDVDSLAVVRGEILSIVGPSGAGKSTLLRLLNFLESPTAGTLSFDSQPVPADPPLDLLRRVTTVFQRPILLSRSVGENVAYGMKLRGLNPDGAVRSALERVGLAGLESVTAGTLSGGEQQRVALARALVINPDVLLLDEPTANLDPYNVGLIESIVKEQNRTQGTTIVLVTHNVFQARRLSQRVGLLLNGTLIELAAASEFFDRPRDPRTAAFVRGEMAY
ncbi:MAG TPA: ATP-binding cassette domain-containing protein [Anaerolineales bacterium]|nr:ATP-binding cassette domain-containing protein [Anaerolineales bacterium]